MFKAKRITQGHAALHSPIAISAKIGSPHEYLPVEIEFEGRTYRGSYYVENGWVTVSCEYGINEAALSQSPAALLAKILLREILQATPDRHRTND